jgi:hypothetical protein
MMQARAKSLNNENLAVDGNVHARGRLYGLNAAECLTSREFVTHLSGKVSFDVGSERRAQRQKGGGEEGQGEDKNGALNAHRQIGKVKDYSSQSTSGSST